MPGGGEMRERGEFTLVVVLFYLARFGGKRMKIFGEKKMDWRPRQPQHARAFICENYRISIKKNIDFSSKKEPPPNI